MNSSPVRQPYSPRAALLAFALMSFALVFGTMTSAHAQSTATAPVALPAAPTAAKAATSSKPATPTVSKAAPAPTIASAETSPMWKELTPQQQTSLKPLAANWATIDAAQKRKWLALSNSYPTLPPPEQQKMHSRMAEWTSLSKQQRDQARLNFAESNKLAPKEKAAKTASKAADWEAYQALSPEEKQKLAAKSAPKPAGAAVLAVKPLPPEKLATVPSTRLSPKPNDRASKLSAVDSNALQPKAPGAADVPGAPGSSVQKN